MRKQIRFTWQGVSYVTIFGCGEYLSTVKHRWDNIAEAMAIIMKSGYATSFRREFGVDVRSMVELQDVSLIDTGNGVAIVTGKLQSDDGTIQDIKITEEGIYIDGILDGIESTQVVGESTTSEQESEPEVKEEVKSEPDTEVVESEPVPEPAPVVEVKSEPLAAPEVHPAKSHKPGMTLGVPTTAMERRVFGTQTFCKTGLRLGSPRCVVPPKPVVKPVISDPTPVITAMEEIGDKIDKEITTAPTTYAATAPNEVLQHLADNWSTDEKQSKEAQQSAIKNRLRASFTPEVNAVIGDIPHLLLGDIEEFSMKPIDYSALKDGGVTYCIQQHWHKCGNWFCMDVVMNRQRVFYNSKKNSVITISIDDCKAWLKAVS